MGALNLRSSDSFSTTGIRQSVEGFVEIGFLGIERAVLGLSLDTTKTSLLESESDVGSFLVVTFGVCSDMDWLSTALGRKGIARLGIADGLLVGLQAICVWEREILIFAGGLVVVNVDSVTSAVDTFPPTSTSCST